MAPLNLVTNFLFEVVKNTWQVATVLVKYLLVVNLGVLAYQRDLGVEKFTENLLEYAKPALIAFAVLGTAAHISGFSITPVFNFYSQLVTMLTLGYLFYRY
jgi:hypothetical protein